MQPRPYLTSWTMRPSLFATGARWADLLLALGVEDPRVAILPAVETVTTKIPSTIDAAALCKMAERGQITGGLLEGPLASDNAIDVEAARIKGIGRPVGGRAQVLVVPDLEAVTCLPGT